MSEYPICNIDDCGERSAYLLPPEGDLCESHAADRHPVTVKYCRSVTGRPPAAKEAEQ